MSDAPTGSPSAPETSLPSSLVLLLAVGAGLSAASLYYNQPILDAMARDVGATPRAIGFVPMTTQLGYAAGILLSAPLGDRLERRRVILVKGALLTLALLAMAVASSIELLVATSLVVGILATVAQDFVPAAAALAPEKSRGKVVGTVMTGLLLGILLSRLASGAVAERFGWRTVYVGAAATIVVVTLVAAKRLPRFPAGTATSYVTLLRSIVGLVRRVAPLRRAALSQALLSVAFSGFWSTLALALARPPFELGSTVAGAFGIAGAAGAIVAPIAGGLADTRGPETVVRSGIVVVVASFATMAVFPGSLVVLVVGAILFDLGIQAALISHQTIVYGLDPAARSRLNAVLVSAMFLGMSAGAAIASAALSRWGLRGVFVLGVVSAVLAGVVRLWPGARRHGKTGS